MKTEKAFAILFLVGLLFKCLHWPGGNVFIILALTFLTLIYFPFAFYFFSDKVFKRQNFGISIVYGWLLSIIPIGIVFKIMFWPGFGIMTLFGFITAPFLLIAAIVLFKKSSEELKNYFRNLLIRTSILTFLIAIVYMIPTEAIINFNYMDRPEIARLQILHYQHPENEDYKKQLDTYKKMDSIQMGE